MGLFSKIGGAIGSAIGGPVGGFIGGAAGSAADERQARKGIENARDAQNIASEAAIDEQRTSLDIIRDLFEPYRNLGESASGQLSNLLGLQTTQPSAGDQPGIRFHGDTSAPGPFGSGVNPTLAGAVKDIEAYNPTANNPVLAGAIQERVGFNPTANPLLAQAAQEQQAFDPTANLSPTILQNPLLQALQADVQKRLFANQAARGKLGSGETAKALQDALIPQALAFGESLNQAQQGGIQNKANLGELITNLEAGGIQGRYQTGLDLDQLFRAALAARSGAGSTLEDLKQRQVGNLFTLSGRGQDATQTLASGESGTASNIGNLLLGIGTTNAVAETGKASARQQTLGELDDLIQMIPGLNFSGGGGGGGGFGSFLG